MLRSLRELVVPCLFLVSILIPGSLMGQEQHADTTAYSSVRLDSSEIRRLPLSRNAEVTSFLPGSALGIGYNAGFSGALGSPDVRIDGVPALNLTRVSQLITLPAFAVAEVSASLAGSSAQFGNLVSVRYTTVQGGTEWKGFANAGTDEALPGSIGNLRFAGGAGGPLGRLFRASVNVTLHSAEATDFNNVDDLQIFAAEGTDTTISFTQWNGDTRTVKIPNFVEVEGDQLPASGWNEQLATARLDFLPSPRVNAFIAGYFSRLQEREAFGGGCAPCALYDPGAQRGGRTESSMITFGIDHAIGAHASAHVRLARSSDETTSGVLTKGGTGLLDQFAFLVDNETYLVTEELIQRFLINDQDLSPYPYNRNDLGGAVEFRMNPYGIRSTYWTRGVANGGVALTDETRLFGSARVVAELKFHRFEVGAEMSQPSARLATVGYINAGGADIWNEKPTILSAFAEDAFQLGSLSVQAGVRFDSFDPSSEFPVTPGYLIPDDPSTVFDAPASSAISPRIAVVAPFGNVKLRVSAGQAAVMPDLRTQYMGKNIDFFRFGFSNTATPFGSPTEIFKVTSLNVGGSVHASKALEFEANVFLNSLNDAPMVRSRPFDDPTNPGSTTYLRIWVNELDEELTGFDASASYRFGERSSARLGVSRETLKLIEDEADFGFGDESHTMTSVVGLLQTGGGRIPGGFDVTLAVRAHSPDEFTGIVDFGFQTIESSWVTRFDARLARTVDIGGLRGSVFIDGLRLLGSSRYLDHFDQLAFQAQIEEARVILGNGVINDNLDLTSLTTAGFGVLNEVDLYFLQQAEARFGNGNGMFDKAEQTAAFGAAARMNIHASQPRSQSRRVVVGAQISF